ncbi:MAG: Ribose-phosphate pyrophosphokinase [bacterium ADurb.Bin400]|nr:MAG: Ribose-phosphate pyrophosphokinase [bacterium ADurb.Bin400]
MSNGMRQFKNRTEAGEKLAEKLERYKGQNAIVYALPRGGVITGAAIAKKLNFPLDLVFARKIGHPLNPEFALGAVSEGGHLVETLSGVRGIDSEWLAREIEIQKGEIRRRRERYLRGPPSTSAQNKIAIIVDDGIATGATVLAAIEEIKAQNPAKLVVAVPVSPPDTAQLIRDKADELVAVIIPDLFLGAVGAYYENFDQVSDEEVIEIMNEIPSDPLIFTFPEFKYLASEIEKLEGVSQGRFATRRFKNEEIEIELQSDVGGQSCLILGSVAPPADRLIELSMLAHTLRKEGATEVIGMMPYLAYSRQDKNEPMKSMATPLISEILRVAGFNEIATIDVHSDYDEYVFTVPIASMSPAQLFAKEIDKEVFEGATIVAPDEGAIERAEYLKNVTRIKRPSAYFKKRRSGQEVESALHGEVGPKAIIVDDILDTGKTMVTTVDALVNNEGVKEIYVIVTHGLFTGTLWETLFDLKVKKIFTTDSIPEARQKASDRIEVISVAPLLRDYLRE